MGTGYLHAFDYQQSLKLVEIFQDTGEQQFFVPRNISQISQKSGDSRNFPAGVHCENLQGCQNFLELPPPALFDIPESHACKLPVHQILEFFMSRKFPVLQYCMQKSEQYHSIRYQRNA